jgi:hypothetical protein
MPPQFDYAGEYRDGLSIAYSLTRKPLDLEPIGILAQRTTHTRDLEKIIQ